MPRRHAPEARARMPGGHPTEAAERLHILLPPPERGQTYAHLADRAVRAVRADPGAGGALRASGPGFVRLRYGAAVGDDVAWLVDDIGVLSVPTAPGRRAAVEARVAAAVAGAAAWRDVGAGPAPGPRPAPPHEAGATSRAPGPPGPAPGPRTALAATAGA